MDASLRSVMARYPTGVTVVGVLDADRVPRGLTVNSFTSVSLEPPLILVCIGHESNSHEHLVQAAGFAVSILSDRQASVAERFARRPSEGRFEGVEWEPAPSGHPVVSEAVAWLDCVTDEVLEAGDHSILIGRAVATGMGTESALLFHRGALGSIGE